MEPFMTNEDQQKIVPALHAEEDERREDPPNRWPISFPLKEAKNWTAAKTSEEAVNKLISEELSVLKAKISAEQNLCAANPVRADVSEVQHEGSLDEN